MAEPFDGSFSGFDDDGPTTIFVPDRAVKSEQRPNRQPRYHVILWDSDEHTFDYVEGMLRELFGYIQEECYKIALSVDEDGRATVFTTTKEHAELKRDQIHAYGKDHSESSEGSMWSTIEPEE